MLWYLSCPIKPVGKETYEDTKRIGLDWYRFLLLQGLDVVAPYWGLLAALDDTKPEERRLGMHIDDMVHRRCDGLVIVGARKRVQKSEGMRADVRLALSLNRVILDLVGLSKKQAADAIARVATQRKNTFVECSIW